MEEWRDIPGWEGIYQASNLGKIRSLDRMVRTKGGASRLSRGRVLVASGPRYDLVLLMDRNQRTTSTVHRLICRTFHGFPPTPTSHAAHIDGNQKNNRADNLRWSSARQNCADRERHGTWVHGASVNTAKLTEAQITEIRRLASSGMARKEIAIAFGVHRSSIDQLLRGDTWRHMPA